MKQSDINFAAVDLDTGALSRAHEYDLADETYRQLVRRLNKDNFAHTDAALQTSVIRYFTDFQPKLQTPHDSELWAQDQSALNQLRAFTPPQLPPDDREERFDTVPQAQ